MESLGGVVYHRLPVNHDYLVPFLSLLVVFLCCRSSSYEYTRACASIVTVHINERFNMSKGSNEKAEPVVEGVTNGAQSQTGSPDGSSTGALPGAFLQEVIKRGVDRLLVYACNELAERAVGRAWDAFEELGIEYRKQVTQSVERELKKTWPDPGHVVVHVITDGTLSINFRIQGSVYPCGNLRARVAAAKGRAQRISAIFDERSVLEPPKGVTPEVAGVLLDNVTPEQWADLKELGVTPRKVRNLLKKVRE